MRLLIRADAGPAIGAGHVMRCLALAQAWIAAGGEATFLSRCESPALQQRIRSAGADLVERPKGPSVRSDLSDLASAAARIHADWVVLDGYSFGEGLQLAVRESGRRLLVIDDGPRLARYHVDLLLNQNVHAERIQYPVEDGAQLLLGTRYALLRPEFAPWRDRKRAIPAVATRILVTLGGGDPDNVTQRVVEALRLVDCGQGIRMEVTVVSGPANPHLEALRTDARESGGAVKVLTAVEDMPALMASADLAVSAGGSTCWELAFMGVPNLILVLADNQLPIANGLLEEGVSLSLGWAAEQATDGIAAAVAALAGDAAGRGRMAGRGRRLVDGLGAARVVEAMMST